MTKKTQVIACIAFVLLIVSGVTLWYVSYEVDRIGNELSRQVEIIANQHAQERKLAELMQLIEETAADRAQLDEYLLSEADTITFLADIERIGVQQGVEIKTNSLDVQEETDTTVLMARFSITGPQELVYKMLTIMESLPYESTLTQLNLSSGEVTKLDIALALTLY